MKFLITLDVGTTSVKTCLFSDTFEMVASTTREYQLLTPEKNIVELDSELYLQTCRDGIRQIVGMSGVEPDRIKVITITTQGETLIPVDADGRALHPAVVWLDSRAGEEALFIQSRISSDEFYRNTGLTEIGPACPICKVLWFKRQRPEIFCRTYKFMLLEDFLIQWLTGEFVTDQSIMSSTGYLNIVSGSLWNKVLEITGISESYFPSVLPCGTIAGKLKKEVADELGLHSGTFVSTGAMDQICSAIGAGNILPGMVTETTGTALVVAATVEKPDFDSAFKVLTFRHFDDRYIIMPYCPTAGLVLKWFKDEFCEGEVKQAEREGISVYQIIDRMAFQVKAAENGLILLSDFAGRLSPNINTYAKGVFFGVGLDTKKEHFIRAIMESIGFMLRENLELIEDATRVSINEVRSIGGGSASYLWNRIKSDICGKRIVTMHQKESTSVGAAMLGALAIGLYSNMEEICTQFIKSEQEMKPLKDKADKYNKAYGLYKKLYTSLKDLFEEAT